MSTLSFFHQKRKDAAVRTGVEVDSDLLLHLLTPGDEPKDSALLWFIDVRIATPASIQKDADAARSFLLAAAPQITSALASCAGELRAGLDLDLWPRRSQIGGLPSGASGEIVCSCMVRFPPEELSKVLQDLATKWTEILSGLPAFQSES